MPDNDEPTQDVEREYDLVKESEKKMGKDDGDAEKSAAVTATQERAVTKETSHTVETD